MNNKERRSWLFGELLACLEMLSDEYLITPEDIRNYALFPREMSKNLFHKVHDSRIGTRNKNMQETSSGIEISRIYDELSIEDMESKEPLEPIYILAKHRMRSKLINRNNL